MIPENITREHLLRAIAEIRRNGIPPERDSTKFHLVFNGERFPPKYVISLANKFANGNELDPYEFSGGNETNSFLEARGFEIVPRSVQNEAPMSVWLEKVYVKGRRHKEQGEYALGKVLLSPQKDRRGADIYKNMRLAKKGDLVLHLTDNEAIVGISKVDKAYDAAPDFTYLREWDGQTGSDPGYLIRLEGFIEFKNPLHRSDVLNDRFRKDLVSILDSEDNVFYTRDLRLRQGAYLTAITDKFMNLINSVYREKNGSDLPYWKAAGPKIALLGLTDESYVTDIGLSIEQMGRVCSTWTYSLSKEKIELLRKQLPFYLYCYLTKRSRGSGLVDYRLRVVDFEYSKSGIPCPHPEYSYGAENETGRGWYTFDKVEEMKPPRTWESFELFDKEEHLDPNSVYRMRQPHSEFLYVKDAEVKGGFVTKEMSFLETVTSLLESKKQVILYGPPGTGKTYKARMFSEWFLGEEYEKLSKDGLVEFITFHPSYSYEEFVEGITVNTDQESREADSGEIQYIQKWGVFKKLCARALGNSINENLDSTKEAWKDQWGYIYEKYKETIQGKSKEAVNNEIWNNAGKFLLIIDEINRGDISKTFGELVTLLEADKRIAKDNQIEVQLPYSNDKFGVPPNLYVIGTMNTADRSIALVDIALRRRFGFVEMAPNFEALMVDQIERNEKQLKMNNVYEYLVRSVDAIKKINSNIIKELGRDKQIGHSFFFKVLNQKDLMMVWQHEILPLLEEYYYCDYSKILRTLEIEPDNPYINKNDGIKGFKKIEELDNFLMKILRIAGTSNE